MPCDSSLCLPPRRSGIKVSFKDYAPEEVRTVEVRRRSVDRLPAQEVRLRSAGRTLIEIAEKLHRLPFVGHTYHPEGYHGKKIPCEQPLDFPERTVAARWKHRNGRNLSIGHRGAPSVSLTARGVDGPDAVELKSGIGVGIRRLDVEQSLQYT